MTGSILNERRLFLLHMIPVFHTSKLCMTYTENFEKNSCIVHRLESAREQTIKSNRHYMLVLLKKFSYV